MEDIEIAIEKEVVIEMVNNSNDNRSRNYRWNGSSIGVKRLEFDTELGGATATLLTAGEQHDLNMDLAEAISKQSGGEKAKNVIEDKDNLDKNEPLRPLHILLCMGRK